MYNTSLCINIAKISSIYCSNHVIYIFVHLLSCNVLVATLLSLLVLYYSNTSSSSKTQTNKLVIQRVLFKQPSTPRSFTQQFCQWSIAQLCLQQNKLQISIQRSHFHCQKTVWSHGPHDFIAIFIGVQRPMQLTTVGILVTTFKMESGYNQEQGDSFCPSSKQNAFPAAAWQFVFNINVQIAQWFSL